MQNEYIDLPISIPETPKILLEKAEPYKVPEKNDDAANKILKTLQTLVKGNPNDLYLFYQIAMVTTHREKFSERDWPTTNYLEQIHNTQYKAGPLTIYKEFVLRNNWNKLKNSKDIDRYCDGVDQAWQQYTSIFKLQYTRINFHPEMIWDYFDSFLDIYLFHKTRIHAVSQSKKYDPQNFKPDATKTMFKQLSALVPTNFNINCTSKQIFGYYSIVALAVIAMSQGNYKQALAYISRFSLKQTAILSKGMGSLLTAFFVSAFSYFMLEQYYKSVKICETIVPFYHKYRKYFDKSFSYLTQLQPMFQKLVVLHCINYIFLQDKPKSTIMQIFRNTNPKTKEKQARDKISDCFFKLKQHDGITFWRLFHFLTIQYSIRDIQRTMMERFKALQQVNLNTIIQNYKRIQLEKISKMLKISVEQILKRFKSLGAVQKTDSPWDSTIMNPLLKQKKKVNVLIEGDVAIFDSQNVDMEQAAREWGRYREQIAWLNEKLKAI